ncbi:protein kinase [Trypanosoma theileri]|uniref:Protein kinase n=1 Tax=Trypanosoma theileri TaxID=67003 RepID=A0A1X0P3S4_9TRYP|nr:protein kinase [Trypanosoma theileri]ORC91572.1 protein kinase [Trypanosoma theileri]
MTGEKTSISCFSHRELSPRRVDSCNNDNSSNPVPPLNGHSYRDPSPQEEKYHQREEVNRQDGLFPPTADTSTLEDRRTVECPSTDGFGVIPSTVSVSLPVTECQEIPIPSDEPQRGVDPHFSSFYASSSSNTELEMEDTNSLPTQMHTLQGSITEKDMKMLERKARGRCLGIGSRTFVAVNIFLLVCFVVTICVLPLEATYRMSLDKALEKLSDASVEPISRAVGTNLFNTEDVVKSLFNSLQLNRTTSIRVWSEENMPEVMQQLCATLRTSNTGKRLLYLHLSSPFSGFGAYCSQQYDGETLVGTYHSDNNSDFRYVIDPKTLLYAEPLEPVYMANTMTEMEYAIEFAFAENAFANVVLPWYREGRDNNWWTFVHNNEILMTFTYPFTDYRGNPAMLTTALQLKGLRYFYDGTSGPVKLDSVMVVELQTGIVLSKRPYGRGPTMWDNWNCTHDPKLCEKLPQVEYLESLNDPYMAAAVEKLGGKSGITVLAKNGNLVGYSFNLEGEHFRVIISRVHTSDERLRVVTIALIRESTLTSSLETSNNRVYLAIVFSIIAIVFAEFVIIYAYTRPLHLLFRGFLVMMQFQDGSKYFKCSSTFNDVAWLQLQLKQFNRQLMYMKTLLPTEMVDEWFSRVSDAKKLKLSTQEKVQNIKSMEQGQENTTIDTTNAIGIMTVPSETTTSHASEYHMSDNRSIRSDESDALCSRLHESILKDELNQFRRRFCSIVCLSMALPDYDHSIDGFVKAFSESSVPLIMRYSGVIEVQRSNFLLVTFGAHSQMAQHQTQAVRFALDLLQILPPDIAECVGVMVDSAEYLVGTCGTPEFNTRTTHGLQIPMQLDLLRLILSLKCHIVVTRPVSIALDKQFLTIPVEAVCCGDLNTTLVLYELRGCTAALASEYVSDLVEYIAIIRRAFLHMLGGRYAEAARLLVQIEGKDVQGDRLLRACRRLLRKGTTKPYVRTWGQLLATTHRRKEIINHNNTVDTSSPLPDYFRVPMLRAKHSFLQEGSELENTLLSGVSARSGCSRAATPANNSFSGAMQYEDACDRPLFEMLIESSIDDNDDVQDAFALSSRYNEGSISPTARSNTKGELPFVFEDHQGNSWVRSVDKLGTGAFSVVYRGMSSLGDLVALKCFALRSRHIEIEDIVEELKLFSQLRHGNIVQYISCYLSSDYLIEVMELVPGGSLDGILSGFGTLSIVTVRRFLRDALNGLMYLHSKNVVHCDVKPHNVLVAMDGVYKLSDFGSSLLRLTNSMHEISDVCEMRGTPGYMAPEVARGELPTGKSDVFSLGITVLELLTGRLPWDYASEQGEEGVQTTQNIKLPSHQGEGEGEGEEEEYLQNNTGREETEGEGGNVMSSIERNVNVEEKRPVSPTWISLHDNVLWPDTTINPPSNVLNNNNNNNRQTTRPPIEELLRSPEQLLIRVSKGEVVPVIPQWLEDDVQDFVRLCVAPDPEKRATVKDLLHHPWMF